MIKAKTMLAMRSYSLSTEGDGWQGSFGNMPWLTPDYMGHYRWFFVACSIHMPYLLEVLKTDIPIDLVLV